MAVFFTKDVADSLAKLGFNGDELAEFFGDWKSSPQNEYESPLFGKDGYYAGFNVHGQMVLRHVHLPPPDGPARERWLRNYKHRSRKTSNRCLIYATSSNGMDHLLLYVVDDPPGAHQIIAHAEFMQKLAQKAYDFIMDGIVAA